MNELIEKIKQLAAEYKALKEKILAKHPEAEEGKLKFKGEKTTQGGDKKETKKTTETDSALKSNPLEVLENPLVQMALGKLSQYGPKDVEILDAEIKKAAEANKKRKKEGKKTDENGKELSSYLVEDEMKALVEAGALAQIKFKNLAEGLEVLVKAKIIAEASYKINAEYKNHLGSFKASLEAAAKAYASFDAKIKLFDLKKGELISANFNAAAVIEATVKAHAEAQIHAIPLVDILGKVDAEAFARAQAKANGELVLSAKELTGALNLEAGASVGVKVDGQLVIKSKSGTPLITLKGSASAEAGAKAAFKAKFQIKDGKLIISVNTSLVVGVGTSLGGEVEIDFKAIGQLIADAFRKDPEKFAERLKDIFEKIKAKAIEAKADLEESIEKTKAKLDESKKNFQAKIDKLEEKARKKAEKMLDKAEKKIEFYENKMNKIKDDARAKVVENLESAKATVAEIHTWLDTKFSSLFD